MTKATTIQQGKFKCLPWHGNYDLDMITPVNEDGFPVLEGTRVCGKKDCVQPAHVKG